jgi:hypothetical protein
MAVGGKREHRGAGAAQMQQETAARARRCRAGVPAGTPDWFDLFYGAQPSKVGQVTHTWAQDGREYRVETIAEAVGFVSLFLSGRLVQRSSGVFTTDGLVPTEYRAELGMRERTEVARFDWAGGKIALASKGENGSSICPPARRIRSMLHQLTS